MLEPRGHAACTGALLVEPDHREAISACCSAQRGLVDHVRPATIALARLGR